MARNYTLSAEPRQFSLRPSAGVITVERDEDDNLNFHRVVGTEMSWAVMDGARPTGRTRTGIVRAIDRGNTLIQSGEEWYLENAKGIHLVEDWMLCPHCGGLII